jgi:hypothetical protein
MKHLAMVDIAWIVEGIGTALTVKGARLTFIKDLTATVFNVIATR